MNSKKKTIIISVLTTVFTGLLVYAAYSLWYIFYGTDSGADVHLYTVLSGIALGWYLMLFVDGVFKKSGKVAKILAFIAGNGFFHGLIWGLNARINQTNTDNDQVIIKTFTVTFALTAILGLIAFILRARKKYKILNIILAVIYFAVSCGGLLVLNKENIKALEYKKNIHFGTISAAEMNVTESEKKLCADWSAEHLKDKSESYPFTFKVDGESFNPTEWEKSVSPAAQTKYKGGNTEILTLTNKAKALEVKAEITSFENNATCQWTVYIKNTGSGNSGVISDFYALASSFNTGKTDLYYSMGSDTAASDFSLIKKKLGSAEKAFSGTDGKPTEKYLPYFNLCGEECGMMLGIGWTGQWAATFSQNKGTTDITVRQENLEAYLLPGEEIRSPLVSVTFYDNANPLKGFNMFRSWISDCVYPENVTKDYYTVMEVAGPASERTTDEIIEILDGLDESVYENSDAFWMDAGWYEYNEGWHDGVGNWTVDTKRYDNGISELSGYAAKKGLGHVLWYEPERLYPGTHFHTVGSQNDQWLISLAGEDNIMWNLADEEAFRYYCDYLFNSMKENGITVYRQDFNFAPLAYWEYADENYYGGRKGITENHYVTNLYRYLDFLTENIDGLIIDNCASGGKRLDLEMTYRSIPFWRSDYNCSYHSDLFNATQSHTYGISFWLPITGSALYMANEYASRSAIMPLMLMDFFSHQHAEFSYNNEQRALMGGRYYPLDFGSYDHNKMLAMQFSTDDALSGTALIYKRAQVNDSEYTVKLNGLIPEKSYTVYDIDKPEKVHTLKGSELMEKGLTVELPEGEKAIILMFSAK